VAVFLKAGQIVRSAVRGQRAIDLTARIQQMLREMATRKSPDTRD